jgi:hypothetical protein
MGNLETISICLLAAVDIHKRKRQKDKKTKRQKDKKTKRQKDKKTKIYYNSQLRNIIYILSKKVFKDYNPYFI